jgi:NADPH2:quinone reductase
MLAALVTEFASYESARFGEVADPVPAADEVLVRVHAAPVNYVDLVTFSGGYQFKPELPYTPGKGPAGVVCAVGSAVTGVNVGDRVLAMAERGGYAELVAVAQQNVYRLPATMSFLDAAAMSLAFDTAWMALRERTRLAVGESVLVLGGSGAVAAAAIQLAKAMGAARVIAGVSDPTRRGVAERAGADAVIDLSQQPLRETVPAMVRAANAGEGVDVVIDPVGGDAFDGALRAMNWRGRAVVVGFASGRIPSVKVNYLMVKNIEVSGLQISDYRKRRPDLMAKCYREVFDLFERGSLRLPPVATYPLADWVTAMRAVEQRTTTDRVILKVRD